MTEFDQREYQTVILGALLHKGIVNNIEENLK